MYKKDNEYPCTETTVAICTTDKVIATQRRCYEMLQYVS